MKKIFSLLVVAGLFAMAAGCADESKSSKKTEGVKIEKVDGKTKTTTEKKSEKTEDGKTKTTTEKKAETKEDGKVIEKKEEKKVEQK